MDTVARLAPHLDAEAEGRRIDAEQAADPAGTVALPHGRDLLVGLPAGGWAVVTSGTRVIADARLRIAGLPRPPALVCAEDVEEGKPAPDGYLEAARRLGAEPGGCVVVEDAPVGLEAGRRAGMATIAVSTTHAAADPAGADRLVAGLAEVLAAAAELRAARDRRA
jgi:sugar-phosphatase